MSDDLDRRLRFAVDLARRAGELGMRHFRALDQLTIERKGHQDHVSNADRELETLVRDAIAAEYPEDGIVGEEHADQAGVSAHVWVIDPIDGTANFVRGIPAWCVVIACATEGRTAIGVIHEPATGETFYARRGGGAFLNGRSIRVSDAVSLSEGSVGTGFSNRRDPGKITHLIAALFEAGGIFFRNASGALMLAYVGAGRLLGYCEEHMNAWDCLAGLLIIEEAGGVILPPDPAVVISQGTMTLAGAPGIFDEMQRLALAAFNR
jgi:myo-inositol-1(or 4)-monophosphatase